MAPEQTIRNVSRIGIVGAGNMGTMMSFGFSEHGLDVSLWDVSEKNVSQAREMAKQTKTLKGKVDHFTDIDKFTDSLSSQPRKIFVFSITHGPPSDSVLEKIWDDLQEGDIILDGGNEHYRNTERRQRKCDEKGVKWIGMGVSGGYQSARRGPSMSPGGDKDAVEFVLPLLETFSAKSAKDSKPCVQYMGKFLSQFDYSNSVNPYHRTKRRWTLCQNGSQWHRKRHAFHPLRGMEHLAQVARAFL